MDEAEDRIARAKAGEEAAWKQLEQSLREPLHGYCRNFIAEATEAEDAVQASFIKAWEKRASFQGRSQPEFKGWLYTIARNECLNRVRRKPSVRLEDPETALQERLANPDACLEEQAVLREMIEVILSRLDARDRLIFLLYYRMEMNFQEISDQLSPAMALKPEGVKARIFGHIRKVRNEVAEQYEFPIQQKGALPESL